MTEILIEKYTMKFESDDLKENIKSYFVHHNCLETYMHTLDVVEEVNKLHKHYDFDFEVCELGAYMHDLGRVVDKNELVRFCEENGHEFLPGERDVPSILHQIASRIISQRVFNVDNKEILNAVECHTTLKSDPSEIDKIVFLSDKLSWKEAEYSALVSLLKSRVRISKEEAIKYYLRNLHENRNQLKCYHKWSKEAYEYFHG